MVETRKELSEYEKARIQYRDCDYKNGIDTDFNMGYILPEVAKLDRKELLFN